MRLLLILCLTVFSLTGCKEIFGPKSPCAGKNWGSSLEELKCRFPVPPKDRWYAVYTQGFANEHDLPLENISKNLPSGVDYMEMDVQPYKNWRGEEIMACLVNMLVKKPHDIALYNLGDQPMVNLSNDRRLSRLIDLEEHRGDLKAITTFNIVSKDYYRKKGFRSTTFAMVIEDALSGYDYISANAQCRSISMKPKYFPDGYALWAAKASIWGKYQTPYTSADNPARPRGKNFYNSHIHIDIPSEIISNIFKDVPVGGQ